jgi:16S rRNA C1402 (ribose-2'-O) methylase RsmI
LEKGFKLQSYTATGWKSAEQTLANIFQKVERVDLINALRARNVAGLGEAGTGVSDPGYNCRGAGFIDSN